MARAISLDIDLPGGEMAGCLDLSRLIVSGRARKPTWAVCSETAFAGACAIASARHTVVVSGTGYVGSVGVIATYMDKSRSLARSEPGRDFHEIRRRKMDLERETALLAREETTTR
jgi:ClpP class serine protease